MSTLEINLTEKIHFQDRKHNSNDVAGGTEKFDHQNNDATANNASKTAGASIANNTVTERSTTCSDSTFDCCPVYISFPPGGCGDLCNCGNCDGCGDCASDGEGVIAVMIGCLITACCALLIGACCFMGNAIHFVNKQEEPYYIKLIKSAVALLITIVGWIVLGFCYGSIIGEAVATVVTVETNELNYNIAYYMAEIGTITIGSALTLGIMMYILACIHCGKPRQQEDQTP